MYKKNNKVLPEHEVRKRILETAERLGCKKDILQIFNKYDNLLKDCKNEEEKKQISTMGSAELYRFFHCTSGLQINGSEVIPPEKI